nr:protein SPO16 homolog isoform X2 [Myodes glareolus]
MDARGGKEKTKWTTTIIISSSLKSYEIATALENRSHKVRYSDTLERGSIVFSLSGVAFLLMDAKECISTEEIFLTKIEKFINIHQNSFLVLFAPLHGPEEWNLMFRIHQRFLGSNLRVLPVHNTVNAADLMCTVAKTSTSESMIDLSCERRINEKANKEYFSSSIVKNGTQHLPGQRSPPSVNGWPVRRTYGNVCGDGELDIQLDKTDYTSIKTQ